MTKLISAKFDQINGESLVKTPKIKPKIAGAIAEFGPSEIVGVTKIAKTIIQANCPIGVGSRLTRLYQHQRTMRVPRT